MNEYVWMIDKVRTYEKMEGLEPAIDRALREMPDNFEIKRYLEANREGVKKMLLTEYDEVKTMRQFKEEGRAEGRAEGWEEGIEQEKVSGIRRAINKLHMTMDAAMDYMDIAAVDQAKYAKLLREQEIAYHAD